MAVDLQDLQNRDILDLLVLSIRSLFSDKKQLLKVLGFFLVVTILFFLPSSLILAKFKGTQTYGIFALGLSFLYFYLYLSFLIPSALSLVDQGKRFSDWIKTGLARTKSMLVYIIAISLLLIISIVITALLFVTILLLVNFNEVLALLLYLFGFVMVIGFYIVYMLKIMLLNYAVVIDGYSLREAAAYILSITKGRMGRLVLFAVLLIGVNVLVMLLMFAILLLLLLVGLALPRIVLGVISGVLYLVIISFLSVFSIIGFYIYYRYLGSSDSGEGVVSQEIDSPAPESISDSNK